MILLDENILDGQRLALEASRLAPRQIGVDIGRKGLKDEEVIVFLRRQRNITFFTRDADFNVPDLRHTSYCLVVLEADGQGSPGLACRAAFLAPEVTNRGSHRLEPTQIADRKSEPVRRWASEPLLSRVSLGYS